MLYNRSHRSDSCVISTVWFAWRPVTLCDGRTAWLTDVLRVIRYDDDESWVTYYPTHGTR